jgi:hypothetical protein
MWTGDIPLGLTGHGFHLRYWEWRETESSSDYCYAKISTNGGISWTNLEYYAGTNASWTQKDYDLAGYSGNVRVRFQFYTDSSAAFEGWYVDDIEISRLDVTGCPSPDGWIELDQSLYACSDSMNISVQDSDLAGAGIQDVELFSITEPTPEMVTLSENPANSGVFRGSFNTAPLPPVNGDGLLSVGFGDTITARYIDADDGSGGTNVPKTDTAAAECQPPIISNVLVVLLSPTSARVSWTTDEMATSRVSYGTSIPPDTNKDDLATYTTSHTMDVTGLTPCTTYYFSVTSADIYGNSATDTGSGTYYPRETLGWGWILTPEDVESGAGNWVATSGGGPSSWHIDTCRAHSGTHAWKAGSTSCPGSYGEGVDLYLTYDTNIVLGPVGHGFHLRYWEYFLVQGYDYCRPQISTDGGTSWTNLGQYYGNSMGWTLKDYDLAAYSGSSVRIRFWFQTSNAFNYEGWYVDDIEIRKTAVCSAPLEYRSCTLTDTCSFGGAGDHNGVIDAGEQVLVTVSLKNAGSIQAANISAVLSSSSPDITVTDDSAAFPDIAPEGTASALDTFGFAIGSAVACGTVIDFDLDITSAEGTWADTFAMIVGNPVSETSMVLQPSVADAYVRQQYPSSNYGTGTFMNVVRQEAKNERSLVEFDLSTVPAGSNIRSARLELNAAGTSSPSQQLDVHHITAPWTESGVTWSNQPTYSGTADAFIQGGTLGGWKAWDVTSVVQAWVAGTYPNYGFLVKSNLETGTSSNGYIIATREYGGETRPILRVNCTLGPECLMNACAPSTLLPPVNSTARFVKETGDILNVIYDAVTCSSDKVIILYANLGTWTGYAGCAQADGGNSGSTTIDSAGQSNVWYNLVWTQGTTAGHPGFGFNGTTNVSRTWTAGTLCGMATDDQTHSTCP